MTGPGAHDTWSFSAICIAWNGFSATTPTKFLRTTTRTRPGIARTDASSTRARVAPTEGGRTTRPCSMPGNAHVVHELELRVTIAGRSSARHRPAEHLPVGRVLPLGGGVEVQQELPAADELAVGRAARGAVLTKTALSPVARSATGTPEAIGAERRTSAPGAVAQASARLA